MQRQYGGRLVSVSVLARCFKRVRFPSLGMHRGEKRKSVRGATVIYMEAGCTH